MTLFCIRLYSLIVETTEKRMLRGTSNESITEKEAATKLGWNNHMTVKFRFIS